MCLFFFSIKGYFRNPNVSTRQDITLKLSRHYIKVVKTSKSTQDRSHIKSIYF